MSHSLTYVLQNKFLTSKSASLLYDLTSPLISLAEIVAWIECIVTGRTDCGSGPRVSPVLSYFVRYSSITPPTHFTQLTLCLFCPAIFVWGAYSTHKKYFTDLWSRSYRFVTNAPATSTAASSHYTADGRGSSLTERKDSNHF